MAAFDEKTVLSDPVFGIHRGQVHVLSDDEDGGWVDAVPDLDFDEVSDFIADTHLKTRWGLQWRTAEGAAGSRRARGRGRRRAGQDWGE